MPHAGPSSTSVAGVGACGDLARFRLTSATEPRQIPPPRPERRPPTSGRLPLRRTPVGEDSVAE